MKLCPKCKKEKNSNGFYNNSTTKDGLRSWCKLCCNKDSKMREPKYKEYRRKYSLSEDGRQVHIKAGRKYYNTIKGHLKCVFNDIKRRCNNPNCKAFKDYGERGIQNKFVSLNEFREYVINILKIDPRGLQIDRIDNNGHYEKNNIKFVTCSENLKNRSR